MNIKPNIQPDETGNISIENQKIVDKQIINFLKEHLNDFDKYSMHRTPSYRFTTTNALLNEKTNTAIYLITNNIFPDALIKDIKFTKKEYNIIPIFYREIYAPSISNRHKEIYELAGGIDKVVALTNTELEILKELSSIDDKTNQKPISETPLNYFKINSIGIPMIISNKFAVHEIQTGIDYKSENIVPYTEIPGERERYKIIESKEMRNKIKVENNKLMPN